MIKIILKKGRDESLRRFHPWVFSGAIAQVQGNPSEGDIVSVHASDGSFLALGHYQIGSIAVRVLSFDESALHPDFWTDMLKRALEVRIACGLHSSADTDCYRLVHGEGDNLPGLIIDYYNGVCVMQAHSVGMFRAKKQITEALEKVYGETLKAVYDKSSGTAPFKAGLDLVDGYMYRRDDFNDDEQIVLENGHKFMVNWTEGQKTGFFLDQRENRALVGSLSKPYADGLLLLEQHFILEKGRELQGRGGGKFHSPIGLGSGKGGVCGVFFGGQRATGHQGKSHAQHQSFQNG